MEKRVKKSLICGAVTDYVLNPELPREYVPKVGDVAIFEVLKIGKHKTIQLADKRNGLILPGDHVMAAFGTRYATEQFEGYLPTEVRREFHVLGAGGTVGIIKSMHALWSGVGPTTLRIVGYATDASGGVINTKYYRQPPTAFGGRTNGQATVILSVGSSMDSGKTTTAGYLVCGLKKTGKPVAFIKLTGTAFSKDKDFVYDCGADCTVDFSDAGFPSTYLCDENELLQLFATLMHKVSAVAPQYVVVEIADGIFQRETRMLLNSAAFMSMVHGVMFSGGDSLGAVCGIATFQQWNTPLMALGGAFTMSPLLIEEVQADCADLPIFTIQELAQGAFNAIIDRARTPQLVA
ncbi:MAG: hypothetical protein H7Z75_06035 [Ferruginibacter sp.]|nr:hypothetical protein [Cytophagales bacterium]